MSVVRNTFDVFAFITVKLRRPGIHSENGGVTDCLGQFDRTFAFTVVHFSNTYL